MAERGATASRTGDATGRRAVRRVVGAAILGVVALSCVVLVHGLRQLAPGAWPSALAGALLGFLAADAITGLVHWSCDTWGSPRTPWLGPRLIRAFREHHRDPAGICRHDWIEVNREPALAAGLGFLLLGLVPGWAGEHPALHAFVWTLLSFAGAANQVHSWAHQADPPAAARWLQRSGLVLSAARHARHHRPPHVRAYCIANGWLNGPLDALGFWPALERGIRGVLRSRRRARHALRPSP